VASCGCLNREAKTSGPRGVLGQTERAVIFGGYVKNARIRKIEWLLTRELFDNLIAQNCFYCGLAPSNKIKSARLDGFILYYSGIDRKDSTLGYTVENCVACCSTCNYAKGSMSLPDFLGWVRRLAENLGLNFAPNIRWASSEVQAANRKNAVFIRARDPWTGEHLEMTEAAWSRHLGLAPGTVSRRMARGWSAEEAVSLPARTEDEQEGAESVREGECPF
jgi:hypothetical protein